MPRGRTSSVEPTAEKMQLTPPREEVTQLSRQTTTRTKSPTAKRNQPRRERSTRRAIKLPKLNLPQWRQHPSANEPEPALPTDNGVIDVPELPAVETPKPKQRKQKRTLRIPLRIFIQRRRDLFQKNSRPGKEKKPKKVRQTWRGRNMKRLLFFLILFVLPYAAVQSRIDATRIGTESHVRQSGDSSIEDKLRILGTSSEFPLSQAVATAHRMAYECFTVPNYGANPNNGNMIAYQDQALADAGIAASDKTNCGWDGKGLGKVDDKQWISDGYWIHADHATVILQIKLYKRPGFFYYYIPFINNHGVPQVAGLPAIFGSASGAEDFLPTCPDPPDSVSTDQFQHTAQTFLNGLAGDKNVDLGYLTYPGASFGGFGPAVSSPRITQMKYCGSVGQEKRFAAMVQFNGPVQGSHYSLPYGFGMVPNPGISGNYQIKDFGPTPAYTGS